MAKKAVIMISLVEESAEKSNQEIEKEIMKELCREPARIPWLKKVERVTVSET
jgi:aerobic-type carbon monoxide dehydrogenase small subunit (CoxS/CutS family)